MYTSEKKYLQSNNDFFILIFNEMLYDFTSHFVKFLLLSIITSMFYFITRFFYCFIMLFMLFWCFWDLGTVHVHLECSCDDYKNARYAIRKQLWLPETHWNFKILFKKTTMKVNFRDDISRMWEFQEFFS